MSFSQRLNALLKKRNLKGKDLAKVIGVTPSAVSRWRNAISDPDEENLKKIADALDVDLRELSPPTAPSYARETPYDKLISDLRADAIRLQESERVLRNRNHELEIELEIMKRRLGIGYFAQAPAPILAAEIANRLLELDPAVSLDKMSDEIRDLLAARSAWNDDQFRSELPLSHQPIVDKFYEVSRQEATPQGRAARLTQEAMAKLKVAMDLDPSVAEKLEEIVAPGTVSGATILHSRQRDRSYPGRDIEQSTQSGVHEQ